MKHYNDSKIYFSFMIASLVIAVILTAVSGYSRWNVEKSIVKHIDKQEFSAAYVALRNPQIFALYENFDDNASHLKDMIAELDAKEEYKSPYAEQDVLKLKALLERRQQGSSLGFYTAIFLYIVSLVMLVFYLNEKRQLKKA